jgi:hypothetical protein
LTLINTVIYTLTAYCRRESVQLFLSEKEEVRYHNLAKEDRRIQKVCKVLIQPKYVLKYCERFAKKNFAKTFAKRKKIVTFVKTNTVHHRATLSSIYKKYSKGKRIMSDVSAKIITNIEKKMFRGSARVYECAKFR